MEKVNYLEGWENPTFYFNKVPLIFYQLKHQITTFYHLKKIIVVFYHFMSSLIRGRSSIPFLLDCFYNINVFNVNVNIIIEDKLTDGS